MKITSIKWRIFKNNIVIIIMLTTLTTIIFNIAVHMYIKKDILQQLNKIASSTENTALQHGPDFFPGDNRTPPPNMQNNDSIFRYYFMLDGSLKEPLTVLNADFILLDKDKNRITPFPNKFSSISTELFKQIASEISNPKNLSSGKYLDLNLSGTEYIAIIKPVSDKNSFGLGWIIIYSNLEKINQLRLWINIILFIIIIFSTPIVVLFSSRISKKISDPFTQLNKYIGNIAKRNFGDKVEMPVYDELNELVNNINIMSEKLEIYDNAQKIFLQNVSHEFRTPLMSIQSYAEGIKYDVVDSAPAVEIILDETKRMTHLVEDLLYLSRLETIEENFPDNSLEFNELVNSCVERMRGIASSNNIKITNNVLNEKINVKGDEEKLSHAITNIISNCIRYADSVIVISLKIATNNKVKLTIADDGPGFESNELSQIFERFYKGKKGNFGLGLSISKNIIEKFHGKITADNSKSGALFIIELPINLSI